MSAVGEAPVPETPSAAAGAPLEAVPAFSWKTHGKFFQRCMKMLPHSSEPYDSNRLTILFFSLSGLDLLNQHALIAPEPAAIIDWIYNLQVLGAGANGEGESLGCNKGGQVMGGFRGAPYIGLPFNPACEHAPDDTCLDLDSSHLAMTYTALACLAILGDDFSRVRPASILANLALHQSADGGFQSSLLSGETDLRFVYCACCISVMLGSWKGVQIDKCVAFIRSCFRYDGCFAQGPLLESHGGSSYCAIASLAMMNRLHTDFTEDERDAMKKWLLLRQDCGFNGRPHKPADTCYSFWIGGALQILDGAYELVDHKANRCFLEGTQHKIVGGFAKYADHTPDPLHSYMALAGLSLAGEPGIEKLDPLLNISQRAAARLPGRKDPIGK